MERDFSMKAKNSLFFAMCLENFWPCFPPRVSIRFFGWRPMSAWALLDASVALPKCAALQKIGQSTSKEADVSGARGGRCRARRRVPGRPARGSAAAALSIVIVRDMGCRLPRIASM
eukprot:scaffold277612_cov27-Tisochrysis_lutea.AAC.1